MTAPDALWNIIARHMAASHILSDSCSLRFIP